jgi:exopolysaccharide biosynthesis polyprenyl glycosylphosphotransferase
VAFFAAWYFRFEVAVLPSAFVKAHLPEFDRYLALLPFVILLWPVVFYFHGLYQVRRGKSRVDEALSVLVATLLATVLLSVVITWWRPQYTQPDGTIGPFTYSRSFLALFATLNLFLVVGGRAVIRNLLSRLRRSGHNLRRILVIGAGSLGKEVTRKIRHHEELGFEVVGFLDDDPGKAQASFVDVPVIGTLADIGDVLVEQRVDQVLITLPLDAYKKTLRVLEAVARECVEVRLVPDILQYATLRATMEDLDGTPVINLSQVPLQGWHSMVKRGMDICIAAAALLILLPFLPLVALLIWIEDHGPIFYHQERMGLDGRPFMIWKLRSMRVNAEASTGPVWAVKDDPRRTIFGSFLRRWSIDELPQLWNILKGEMSIVGPRPERPAFVSEFKNRMPQYMHRHRVKAGLTGWAQVHGWRGNTSVKKRLQYDLYYIENWSLKLDVKILWMTLRHGLKINAY